MTENTNGANGAADPTAELTDEQKQQLAELQQAQHEDALMRTMLLATMFLPQEAQEKLPQETARRIADQCLQATPQWGQVLADVVESPNAEQYPYWGLKLRHARLGEAAIHLPKDLRQIDTLEGFMQYMICIAFCLTPVAHAFASFNGAQVQFFQTAEAPPSKSKIIMPGQA